MIAHRLLLIGVVAMTGLSLSACRNGETSKLAEQDDGLNSNDPTVKAAIEDQIMVDPAMAGRSNANAATPGARPVTGGVPAVAGGGRAVDAQADARAATGGLLHAPQAARFEDQCDGSCDRVASARPATLGGIARQQAGGSCAADVRYGAEWAQRLPAAFPVYPRAALNEAAGVMNGTCNVRVVNFQSRAGITDIVDYYYTLAIRNGYTAEHLVKRDGEHYLGGTKGNDAFVVMVRPLTGGSDVDLVASGGR